MKIRLFIILSLGLQLIACTSHDLKKVDVNQKADFSGTLQHEMFYGPPGFGEDTMEDAKEPAYILHVDKPFLFRDTILAGDFDIGIDSCAYDTVNTIQVRVDHESNKYAGDLKNMVGKKVTIACTLYGAHTGHHHAPALTEKVYGITK